MLSGRRSGAVGTGQRIFFRVRATGMSELIDEDLYRRAKALLEPGEIELNGLVLHTDFDRARRA